MPGKHIYAYELIAAEILLYTVGAMQQEVSAVTPLTTVVSRSGRSAALMGGYSALRTREV